MSCIMLSVGVPLGIVRAIDVSRLPQPAAGELTQLELGSTILLTAQIPVDVPTVEGLAIYYIEEEIPNTPPPSNEPGQSTSSLWQRVGEATTEIDLTLSNGEPVTVRISPNTNFSREETIERPNLSDGINLRYAGFFPGQIVTIEGDWAGSNQLVAQTLHQGSMNDYVRSAQQMPLFVFISGLTCFSISIALLVGGRVLRFFRR